MRCECGGTTWVPDTRPIDDERVVKRRRECFRCGARFTTFECRMERVQVYVPKHAQIGGPPAPATTKKGKRARA